MKESPSAHRAHRYAAAFLALACLAPMGAARAAGAVPAEFQGTWVPRKAGCDSPLHVRIAADRLVLENGKDTETFKDIEMAGSGYFAHDYTGNMAVLLTEPSGDQPVITTFNVGEKKGAAQVGFAPVMPGKANPALAKYNAHVSKLNLAKRFPIDQAALKRCAGPPVK